MPPTKLEKQKAAPRTSGATASNDLVAALAERLKQARESPDLPLVVINRLSQTRSAHVLVIWDQWRDLPIPKRSHVIADAFALAFPNEDVVVRMPIGLTSGEAFSQGYLRYQINALVRSSDQVSAKQVKEAMAVAGGVLLHIGGDQQLRFPTRAQADEAYRRLVQRINKPIWALSEEAPAAYEGE